MKALFLVWHRSNRRIDDFYEFVPYMYGPCSFSLYRELETARAERHVVQAPHPVLRWTPYFLTLSGKLLADRAASKIDRDTRELIKSTAIEVQSLPFLKLLQRVYSEAPDFATKSVARGAVPQ